MFQVFTELVTAAVALLIPVDVPFSFNTAAYAAASQNDWVSFLAINARPTSTAIPSAPTVAMAAIAIVISMNPPSRLRFVTRISTFLFPTERDSRLGLGSALWSLRFPLCCEYQGCQES